MRNFIRILINTNNKIFFGSEYSKGIMMKDSGSSIQDTINVTSLINGMYIESHTISFSFV